MTRELKAFYTLSPLQQLDFPLLQQHQVSLWLKRDDLIHPQVSGNKWRKLKYNLQQAMVSGKQRLLTFGGAYSNHLHAFAAACQLLGLEGVAIVRGEAPAEFGATLQFIQQCGVQLVFVSREEYRRRHDADYLHQLQQEFAPCEIIPEGGSNALALRGMAELIPELEQQLPEGFDVLATAVGSGGTLAGALQNMSAGQQALGVCVLKGAEYLQAHIQQLAGPVNADWQLSHDYHFGGYARFTEELLNFMREFRQHSGIALEPIYTGKLMYAVFDLVARQQILPGSRVVALHTGGMQGLDGLQQRFPTLRERL